MTDLNAWLGSSTTLDDWSTAIDATERAYDTARRIAERTASIVVLRKTGNLAAQTMRIDLNGGPSEQSGTNETASNQSVLVTGYDGHPTITNTNLRRGDRFFYDGDMYTVTQVVRVPGRLLAAAEVSE